MQKAILSYLAAAAITGAASVLPAHAAVISDPTNDFIPSYAGPYIASLDVVQFSAEFDGSTFHVGAIMAGPISASDPDLYVIGFYRGRASPNNFAAIGLPNVIFDAVITLTGAGVLGGGAAAGAVACISGNSFTIDIPLASLPSQGLQPLEYGVNLWPRNSSLAAGNSQITDFAPDSFDLIIPEPMSLALVGTAVAGLSLVRRRHAG